MTDSPEAYPRPPLEIIREAVGAFRSNRGAEAPTCSGFLLVYNPFEPQGEDRAAQLTYATFLADRRIPSGPPDSDRAALVLNLVSWDQGLADVIQGAATWVITQPNDAAAPAGPKFMAAIERLSTIHGNRTAEELNSAANLAAWLDLSVLVGMWQRAQPTGGRALYMFSDLCERLGIE